jgi:hypothetical protein
MSRRLELKKATSLFLIIFLMVLSGNLLAQDESSFTENFSLSTQTEVASPSLAEVYLKRLAERKRTNRRTRGAVGLIGGGICLGLGAVLWSSAEEKGGWEGFFEGLGGVTLIALGGTGIVVGGLSLAFPSGAERELTEVLKISDPAQREVASQEALSYLATRGKRYRIITSIVFAGISVYSLFRNENEYGNPGIFGAFAVYSLLRKTPEERAFQNYQQVRDRQNNLGLHLGIGPHGGVVVSFSFSY